MLVPMLTALVKRGGILFRTPPGEPHPIRSDEKVSGQMKTAINGARRRTGIEDVSPYTARHSVSTELNNRGVSKITKDQILGHYHDGDPSFDYTHVDIKPA
jgi:integrase/recombinase XerD